MLFCVIGLCEGNYANLVEYEEEHVECIDTEERIALPLLELALDNCRNDSYSARSKANGEVEGKVDSVNGEGTTVNYCAKGKNKGGVNDVSAYNVTNGEGIFLLTDSGKSGNKLGKRGTERDNGEADNRLADAHTGCKGLTGGYEELRTENDGSSTEHEEEDLGGNLLLVVCALNLGCRGLSAFEKVAYHEGKEDCPKDEGGPYGETTGEGKKGETYNSAEKKSALKREFLSADDTRHSDERYTHYESGVCGYGAYRVTDSELGRAVHSRSYGNEKLGECSSKGYYGCADNKLGNTGRFCEPGCRVNEPVTALDNKDKAYNEEACGDS